MAALIQRLFYRLHNQRHQSQFGHRYLMLNKSSRNNSLKMMELFILEKQQGGGFQIRRLCSTKLSAQPASPWHPQPQQYQGQRPSHGEVFANYFSSGSNPASPTNSFLETSAILFAGKKQLYPKLQLSKQRAPV
jgi:hypothetical protein